MPTQRERAPLQEFVKFPVVGAAVMGRVIRQGRNDNGRFLIIEPAAYRKNAGEPFDKYASLAVGLSSDLERQIPQGETGAVLLIVYAGARDTGKASPLKLYSVFELTPDEARDIFTGQAPVPQVAATIDDAQGVPQLPDLF